MCTSPRASTWRLIRKLCPRAFSRRQVLVVLYGGVTVLTVLALFSSYSAVRLARYMVAKDLDVISLGEGESTVNW